VRVTDKMIFDSANTRSARARSGVDDASRQMSTGLRVEHPWDDPSAAAGIIRLKSGSDRSSAIAEVATRVVSELNATDEALGGMNDVLSRARDLAVQFGNGTYAAEERAAAATEVNGLIQQTLTFANTRFGGRYLFAGFRDSTQPFDGTGAYSGDDGIRRAEVAPGQFEDASVSGSKIFQGTGGGVDIFATLRSLKTALEGNDAETVRASIATVDQSIDQVTQGRAKAGTGVNVFETARSAALAAQEGNDAAASKLSDADVIATASKLALAQRALDASLTASAKSFNLSLLDKLGR
jgi:flagellar hook-associated protein 3 FlgL